MFTCLLGWIGPCLYLQVLNAELMVLFCFRNGSHPIAQNFENSVIVD
jgi:hypothetical protein